DKKNRKVEVHVEEIETVSGPWGEVKTARVLVVMPFQGLFLNQGNIRVWFTTDDRRVPVRMKAKIVIGSIVADLVSGWQGILPPNAELAFRCPPSLKQLYSFRPWHSFLLL